MKAAPRRLQAIVELIAHDLAGLGLQVDQARRPGKGPGQNAFVGLPPPRLVRRAASQPISQLPERRPILPWFPRQLPEHRLALGALLL